MKARVAMFKSEYGNEDVSCFDLSESKSGISYIRISEWEEIELHGLCQSEIIESQITALDKQAWQVQSDAQKALDLIHRKKAELLALPYVEV